MKKIGKMVQVPRQVAGVVEVVQAGLSVVRGGEEVKADPKFKEAIQLGMR